MSPLSKLEKQFGVKLSIPDNAAKFLCKRAVESRTGVRYLRSQLLYELNRQLFLDPDKKEIILFENPEQNKPEPADSIQKTA